MKQREVYTYDKKGQLLSKLDKEGYLTKYAYTKQGDLSGIQYADGREVKLSYNPLRQLMEVQDWLGNTKITPDALGRAQKVQYPDGREVSYTYGKAGERRSMTYPDGKTVFYGYDEQLRLSELKEGDSIITYAYDPLGRLCEKQFPNGTKTTYAYDRKDQLTELAHSDKEGILDRYTYLYDLLGNKTGITKERRGLTEESGSYHYGYDVLGRLSEIQKDGQMQTRYGYDAFGNRTWKEESGERTSYQYNVINQMVSEKHGELLKAYSYDKRGNLTGIQENGAWKKQYVYGAINRLEEAVDAAGKQARYQYNGLGHRVGKQEGVLPKEKLEKLDPQSRIGMEIGNSQQITYTLDLTRQYYNLLERTEENRNQRYFWDGNVAAYEENGERNYYLQDELGSPLRIEDSAGILKESYGYGAFGEDLYQNQGKIQPFGYTGYQRDETAGTYYAQAREYLAENGRFAGQDLIAGFMDLPFSMNRYSYCFNAPMILVDLDGQKPVSNITPTEEGCKHGWFADAFYTNIEGPNAKLNPVEWENGNKGQDIGAELVDISGGLAKIGYKDEEGILRGKYSLDCVHGNIYAGASTNYIGLKAQGSCVTIEGKVRVIQIGNKRISIGAGVDILSVGGKLGFDQQDHKFEVGLSLGVGASLSISWEDTGCND